MNSAVASGVWSDTKKWNHRHRVYSHSHEHNRPAWSDCLELLYPGSSSTKALTLKAWGKLNTVIIIINRISLHFKRQHLPHCEPCRYVSDLRPDGAVLEVPYILIPTGTVTCNAKNLSLEGQVIYLDVVLHVVEARCPSLWDICCSFSPVANCNKSAALLIWRDATHKLLRFIMFSQCMTSLGFKKKLQQLVAAGVWSCSVRMKQRHKWNKKQASCNNCI